MRFPMSLFEVYFLEGLFLEGGDLARRYFLCITSDRKSQGSIGQNFFFLVFFFEVVFSRFFSNFFFSSFFSRLFSSFFF